MGKQVAYPIWLRIDGRVINLERRMESNQEIPQTKPNIEKPKWSKLAIIAMVIGIGGWLILGPIGSIVGIVLGIIAVVRIKKSKGRLKGWGFAVTAIVVTGIQFLLYGFASAAFWESIHLGNTGHNPNPKSVLSAGRLALLPNSATEIKINGWHGMFTGSDYLMFKASPAEINAWLSQCQSIKEIEPMVFMAEHKYTVYRDEKDFKNDEEHEKYYKQEHFFRGNDWPDWYDPTIETKGRKYEIPGDPKNNGHNWGSIIVNDETNTVYVWVCWS
jgi:hypothetical protein